MNAALEYSAHTCHSVFNFICIHLCDQKGNWCPRGMGEKSLLLARISYCTLINMCHMSLAELHYTRRYKTPSIVEKDLPKKDCDFRWLHHENNEILN